MCRLFDVCMSKCSEYGSFTATSCVGRSPFGIYAGTSYVCSIALCVCMTWPPRTVWAHIRQSVIRCDRWSSLGLCWLSSNVECLLIVDTSTASTHTSSVHSVCLSFVFNKSSAPIHFAQFLFRIYFRCSSWHRNLISFSFSFRLIAIKVRKDANIM